jgi:hypothetical protein
MVWTLPAFAVGSYFVVQAIRGIHPYGFSIWEKIEPGKPIRMSTRIYYAIVGIVFIVFGILHLLKRI